MSHHTIAPAPEAGENDWDDHKAAIQQMYVVEGRVLTGEQGVIALMKERFGKSQYARRLSKWGFRKYSKETAPKHWKTANYKVSKAKKSGKRVQLVHKGSLVTEKVLRTQGYLTTFEQSSFEALAKSPRTPPEFILHVQTPPTSVLPYPSIADFWSEIYCGAHSIKVGNQLQQFDDGHRLRFITYVLSNNLEAYFETWLGRQLMRGMRRELLGVLKGLGFAQLLFSERLLRHPTSMALRESIFRLSIEAEDLQMVRYLLQNGMNPNDHRCHHAELSLDFPITPVQFALLSGNQDMAKLLVEHDAKLDDPGNGWKCSAVSLAILGWQLNRHSRIRDLQESDPAYEDISEITSFVRFLMDNGAKVTVEELGLDEYCASKAAGTHSDWLPSVAGHWYSPLAIVARYELVDLLYLILDEYESLDQEDYHLDLRFAFSEAFHNCMRWCVDYGGGQYWTYKGTDSRNHDDPEDALEEPCEETPPFPTAVVASLLKSGANVFMDDCQAFGIIQYWDDTKWLKIDVLELASYSSSWSDGADFILNYGFEPTTDALEVSIRKDNFQTFSKFVEHISNIFSEFQDGSMLRKLTYQQSSWLQFILEGLEDRDDQIEFLHLAIRHCTLHLLDAFLSDCQLAASLLIKFSDTEDFVEALSISAPDVLRLSLGCDIRHGIGNIVNADKLLYLAIIRNNMPLAKELVHAGAPINVAVKHNDDVDTALCAAIRQGCMPLVDILLEKGARWLVPAGVCGCGHERQINALIAAVEVGSMSFTRRLLDQGADINSHGTCGLPEEFWQCCTIKAYSTLTGNVCSCSYVTPLTASLLFGSNLSLLLALLDSGANPKGQPDSGDGSSNHLSPLATLLCSPIRHYQGNKEEFKLLATQALLDAGASPYDTPAILAPLYDEADCHSVKILVWRMLAQSASDTVPNIVGTAALIQAIRMRDDILVKYILNQKIAMAPEDYRDVYPHPLGAALEFTSPLFMNASDGAVSSTILRLILEEGFVPQDLITACGRTRESKLISPINATIMKCDVVSLNLLLQLGVRPPSSRNKSSGFPCPFQVSVLGPFPVELCLALFEHGLQPASSPIEVGHLVALRIVLPRGSVLETAFQTATVCQLKPVINLMISKGVDVNAAGNQERGATALQFAFLRGDFDMAQLLIDHGADVNAPPSSYDGATCLQTVVRLRDFHWVKDLVRRGADVNARPRADRPNVGTALQIAAREGQHEMVRYLVDHGADVNGSPAPNRGATALQYAAMYGFYAIAEFLLRRGAGIYAMGAEFEGRTALEGAAEHGRLDMVQLLLSRDVGRAHERSDVLDFAMRRAGEHGYSAIRYLIGTYMADAIEPRTRDDLEVLY
ncbi:hypothetical protein E8E14_005866 [Neopestalotiopsis sp. 37M]|nr:hypothetical protein E8E14_005866 [Neopestalotiopsis sp. 37M]